MNFYKQVHLSFKKTKYIPQVNYGKQPTTRTNVVASQHMMENINLADVVYESVDRKDSRKQTFRADKIDLKVQTHETVNPLE